METSKPNMAQAKEFAEGVHAKFPGKLLAYNCSPSFNWKKNLSDDKIATFQQVLLVNLRNCGISIFSGTKVANH